MDENKLRCVVGSVDHGKPATIRFYGRVDEYSSKTFNEEFLWLQDVIRPSKITVSINSEGGSVLSGMGTYSIIQNCPIPVDTIVEGIAASMGSILWAAGDQGYMRDYSILMIHNPFVCGDMEDGDAPVVDAFRKQIEMVYMKRFGLSQDRVREIMDGDQGCDGTYFDAQKAVEAGILPADHVLETPRQVRDAIYGMVAELSDAASMRVAFQNVLNVTSLDGIAKPTIGNGTINNQITDNSDLKTMEEKDLKFNSIRAQLGMEESTDVSVVIGRVNDLLGVEAKLKETQAALNDMKIQKEGLDAQLDNVKGELADVKGELQGYKDAEKAQRDAAIEAFVDAAIADGKINAEAKGKWIEMSQMNFDMVQDTLNSIASREKISVAIASDASNVENAKSGMTDAEAELQKKVADVVGKDFKFNKLADL